MEDALFQGEIGAEEKELQQLFEQLVNTSILSPIFREDIVF